MAVNKVFPRSLSKSKDTRFRKKTEMSDALNLRATESVDAFMNGFVTGETAQPGQGLVPGDAGGEISPTGNMGVLKPVSGTTLVNLEIPLNGEADPIKSHSIIGSVSDETRGHIYFFVWHQNQDKHTVLRYSDEDESLILVYQSKWFNFSYNSVVQGSVTHVSSASFGEGTGEKTFLYFTDNYNEPRCLDINACLNEEPAGYTDQEVVQFISLCPIAPTVPVVAEFGYDPLRNSTNFRNNRGLQFAYQNVYRNGSVSAFSIYSKLVVNPSYLFQGADPTPDIESNNYISVRIPAQNNNVESIRLYGREGNDGPWFFIDDFRQEDAANQSTWNGPFNGHLTIDDDGNPAIEYQYYAFTFYGDKVVSYIAEDLAFKQFDSVPKLAEALAISNDRLFMSNYVEGFDRPNIQADITYEPTPRPEDEQSLDLVLIPEVRAFENQNGVKNRTTGYRLKMSDVSAIFEAGSTVNINITVNPDRNIHLYNSKSSFHASTFFTHNHPENSSLLKDRFSSFENDELRTSYQCDDEYDPLRKYFNKTDLDLKTFEGTSFLDFHDLGWDPMSNYEGASRDKNSATWTSTEDEIDVVYGSSAANPLILSGEPMIFYARVFCETDVTKAEMRNIIRDVLAGKVQVPSATQFGDPDPAGPGEFSSDKVSIIDVKPFAEYRIDLNYNSYDYIPSSSPNFNKICAVGNRSLLTNAGDTSGIPPCGYFIVNQADVVFGLTVIESPDLIDLNRKYEDGSYEDLLFSGPPQTQDQDLFFALELVDIYNEEVLTCVPDIPGGYQPTLNVVTDALIRKRPSNVFSTDNVTPTEFFEDVAQGAYWGDDYINSTFCEQATNKVSGWVCLRKNAVNSIINGGSLVPLLNALTSVATIDDVSRLAAGVPANNTLYGQDTFGAQQGYLGGMLVQVKDVIVQGASLTGFVIPLQPDEDVNSGYNADSALFINGVVPELVKDQIKRFIGYMDLPGRSTQVSGGGGPVLDDGRPFGSGSLRDGTLVCTRSRVVAALNEDLNLNFNFFEDAEEVLRVFTGYTLVDGESGPGSTNAVGSINSTTIRDGVQYYYLGSGLTGANLSVTLAPNLPQPFGEDSHGLALQRLQEKVDAFAAGLDFTVFMDQQGNLQPYPGANGPVIDVPGDPFLDDTTPLYRPPALGYFTNPFEYFYCYRNIATVPLFQAFQVNTTHTELPFDGRIGEDADIKNFGPSDVNLQPFFAADQVVVDNFVDDNPTYYFTDIQAWYVQQLPQVEISQQLSFISIGGDSSDRKTFKSNSNHSFGIVYSDFYGRQSTVYPLGSAFVPPMGLQTGGDGGAVNMKININTAPPSWAYSYQIVYGGNTTYDKFIQYTAGGAFVSDVDPSENDDIGVVSSGNIYVSLNYLQGNSDVSYVDAFGARPTDGSDRFYEYRPGDKLRVVSYYDGGTLVFANNIEFDVVGVATLGDNEDNPLFYSDQNQPVPKYLQGNFVILKNNSTANGFNVNAIKQGGNVLPNVFSRWNNRCVIELYSPSSIRDQEEVPFHEIGESYKVVRVPSVDEGGNSTYDLYHQYNPMTIRGGDVYFRRHALNMPLNFNGGYQSIINESGVSTPLFFNFYLESSTFNDNIVGAKQTDKGRIKVVDPNASEIRRYSSVIFSDQDDYADTRLRLNSFDATKSPFKDLPNSYGNACFLGDYNDSLFVLQQTKASIIPVNRTLISDASGSEALVVTSKVLGNQKYFAGENGCDTNPESVVMFGNTVFWANKQKGEVYKFTPSSGVKTISDLGMRSYFRDMFRSLKDPTKKTRISGGYDIMHDEYILSAYNQEFVDFTSDLIVTQDEVSIDGLEGDGFVDLGTGTAPDLSFAEALDIYQAAGGVVLSSVDMYFINQQLSEQEAEINALLADVQATQAALAAAEASGSESNSAELNELLASVVALNQEADALGDNVRSGIETQVQLHQEIRDAANVAWQTARGLLENLGYTYEPVEAPGYSFNTPIPNLDDSNVFYYGEFGQISYGDPTFDGFNEVATFVGGDNILPSIPSVDGPLFEYPVYNAIAGVEGPQPRDLIANFIAHQVQYIYNLVSVYNSGTTSIVLRSGEVYEFEIGYGAGPTPPVESFFGEVLANIASEQEGAVFDPGSAAAGSAVGSVDVYSSSNFALAESQFTGVRNIIEFYISTIAQFRTEQESVLAGIANEATAQRDLALNQLYQIAVAIDTFRVPDLTVDNPEDIPDSIQDYSVSTQVGAADIVDELYQYSESELASFQLVKGLTASDGSIGAILSVLESQGANQSDLGYREYIKRQLQRSLTIPTKEKRLENFDNLTQVEATRNSLAYSLSYIMSTFQGSNEEFYDSLVENNVSADLASVLTNSAITALGPDQVFDAVLEVLDTDGDGALDAAEIISNLPAAALEAAAAGGGVSTWEAARSSVEGLINDVIELSTSVGIIDPVPTEETAEGFALDDISLTSVINDALINPQWQEGDVDFIASTIDDVRRRINAGDGSKADLIKIYEEIRDRLVQMSVIASQAGYSSFAPETSVTAELQSEVFRGTWHIAVDQVKDDVDQVVTMLKDFQNLFSAASPDDLNVITAYTDDTAVGAVAGTPSNAISYGAASLDGVKAGQLLSGTNIQYRNESGDLVDLQSAFFGLASVISKVNTNIKTLSEISDPSGIAGLFLNENGQSLLTGGTFGSFADLNPNERNITAVLSGDVTSDLINQYEQFTTADVASLFAGALDPASELFNNSFADQVAQSIILPAYNYGYNNNTNAFQGDFTGDGFLSWSDVVSFSALIAQAFPPAAPINITAGGNVQALVQGDPVPIIPPTPFPSDGIAALNFLASVSSGGDAFVPTIDEEDLIDPTTFST
jgi:hypothetical protein